MGVRRSSSIAAMRSRLLPLVLVLVVTACKRQREPEVHSPNDVRAAAQNLGFPPQPPPPPYQGGYRLPFDGEWFVISTHYKNKPSSPQAHAVDIGKHPVRSGKGVPNDQHGCWGEPILADGPGVIALAVDGIYDNQEAGVPNRYDLHGNYVVIDHKNGEFSLFAHLQQGSVAVKAGQVVQMGQVLGLCGNSGRSFKPHVHWQVMSHPHSQYAHGVPIRHMPFLVNGQPYNGRLERGQKVKMP